MMATICVNAHALIKLTKQKRRPFSYSSGRRFCIFWSLLYIHILNVGWLNDTDLAKPESAAMTYGLLLFLDTGGLKLFLGP